MDSAKLNDWMQVVGIFALVASLIFVGLQMRQAHRIALAETYLTRAQMTADILAMSAATPEFTSATAKIYRGEIGQITPEERVALEYQLAATISNYENLHYQYLLGFLPEEHWLKSLRDIKCVLSLPLNRTLLKGWEYRDSFQQIVDEILDEIEESPSACWDVVMILPND